MAAWHDLPIEIHYHILSVFCADVIDDYTHLEKRHHPRQPKPRRPFRVHAWQLPPAPLISFSSALLTCRSFYNALIHDLKFNGVSSSEVLQSLQASRLKGLVSKYRDAFEIGLHVHVKEVGWFWKNPRVIEDPTIIPQVLAFKLSPKSLLTLLPHLEPWVTKHVTKMGADEEVTTMTGGAVFISRRRRVGPFLPVRICSVDEVYSTWSATTLQRTLVEMVKSARENWWLFNIVDRSTWFLVNYVDRRIYSGEQILCTWDDVWDPDSWKVDGYGTLADYWCRKPPKDTRYFIEDDPALK